MSLPSPAILGNHNLKVLRVCDLVAFLPISILTLDDLTPSALSAYALNALASLLANLASMFVKFSYFSIPIIMAILLSFLETLLLSFLQPHRIYL